MTRCHISVALFQVLMVLLVPDIKQTHLFSVESIICCGI